MGGRSIFGLLTASYATGIWSELKVMIFCLDPVPNQQKNCFCFSDAIREVKKYSTAHGTEKAANINPNAYDHIQMKLFRSQRNLYISGFSLFLWLVSNTGSNKKIGKLDGQIYKKGLKELNMDSLAKIVSMLKVETNC
uniref:Endoplasmic reticulum transmembrane protein n=1 Tax=Gopherus agassizii TaxID=38772 RepID=A0A452I6J3_9SAUR